MITRRDLLGFVALGGLVAIVRKRFSSPEREREAMFWEKECEEIQAENSEEAQ